MFSPPNPHTFSATITPPDPYIPTDMGDEEESMEVEVQRVGGVGV